MTGNDRVLSNCFDYFLISCSICFRFRSIHGKSDRVGPLDVGRRCLMLECAYATSGATIYMPIPVEIG